MTALVCAWALRLGTFLVVRIHHDGGRDSRFDGVRDNPPKFLLFWTIQGVWVWVTALPLWLVNGAGAGQPPMGWLSFLGVALWAVGFAVEATADWQKWQWKQDPGNKGKWIDTGLWSLSRHPNYCGEITMWGAFYVVAAGALRGWQLAAAAASPLFVAFLLLKVSGVPLLRRAARKRWGGDAAYQAYVARTRLLLPLPKWFGEGYQEF